jgi:hypothetical protein
MPADNKMWLAQLNNLPTGRQVQKTKVMSIENERVVKLELRVLT